MARQDINRAAEMGVFVEVVDAGGFTSAAQRLKMTPSAVSKLISRLEARLGTRLLYRQLAQLSGKTPQWNFHKYLLGRDGKLVDNYSSMTAPDSKSLIGAIEQQLAAPAPR
eukprot:gene41042-50784_t